MVHILYGIIISSIVNAGLDPSTDLLDSLVKSSPIWAPIIGGLITFIFLGEKIRGWIGFIREEKKNITKTKDQRKIEIKIVKKIHTIREVFNKQIGFNAFPYDLEIKWTDVNKTKADVDKDSKKVILILQSDDTTAESFTRSVYFYSKKGLIPHTKPYIPTDISSAIDLTMTKKILAANRPDAIEFFQDEILKDDAKKKSNVRTYYNTLENLDDKGQFINFFLKELHDFGIRVFPTVSNKYIEQEIKEFMQYATKLANRKEKEDLDQDSVQGKYLRVGVVYIAGDYLTHNYTKCMTEPSKSVYWKHITKLVNDKVDSIYLLAKGDKNIAFTKILLDLCRKNVPKLVNATFDELEHPYSKLKLCPINTTEP